MGRTQRLALITGLALLLIAVSCLVAIRLITQVTETRVGNVLVVVRDSTLESLTLWLSETQRQVTGWASSSAIIAHSVSLTKEPLLADELKAHPSQALIRSILSPLAMEDHYQGFFIVDLNNKIVASSTDEEIGAASLLEAYPNYLDTLFSGESFISIPLEYTVLSENLGAVILTGAPIRDRQGQVIAALVFLIDPIVDFSRILQGGRILESGETYAVSSNGTLISESRFDDQLRSAGIIDQTESSILNVIIKDPGANLLTGEPSLPEEQQALTRMASSLLQQETGSDVSGYPDYRGVEVVGAWAWSDEYGFGIATEVDKAEAYANVTSVSPVLILLSLLSGGALVGTAVLSHLGEKRERMAQRRYELTVEGAKEAIISFDSSNHVTAWNRQAELMFGWEKAQAVGRDMSKEVLPADNQNFYINRLEEIRRDPDYFNTRQRREIDMLRRNGTRFPTDVFLVPVKIGNDEGYSAVIRDLTDLKEAQAEAQRSHEELTESYDATLRGWSSALDLRDNETEGHTQRVTALTIRLAEALGVPNPELVHIYRGALLHDIGKIGIPDSVLLKPGPLDDDEWAVMKLHPTHALRFLNNVSYLRPSLDIPHYHHEKWDGSGYPKGLKGKEIPYSARMFAVVDVWDALTSDRPYRKAWSHEKARAFIDEQRGKHFDPEIIDAFLKII